MSAAPPKGITISKDALKYVLALEQTPVGHAALIAVGGPGLDLAVKYGALGIGMVIDLLSNDVTEEAIVAALASKGFKVTPIDLGTLYDPLPATAVPTVGPTVVVP